MVGLSKGIAPDAIGIPEAEPQGMREKRDENGFYREGFTWYTLVPSYRPDTGWIWKMKPEIIYESAPPDHPNCGNMPYARYHEEGRR
jgi:hypothetical protein